MGQKPKTAHKNRGSQTGDLHEKGKKIRVHIYIDREVFEGLREEGYSLSKLFNRLGREKLMEIGLLKERYVKRSLMAGPAGFEPATFASGGRRSILTKPRALRIYSGREV